MNAAEDRPIRVGIAGLGRSGWSIHAMLFESLAQKYRISAVFDTITERREEAVERFKCRQYSDFIDLIEDSETELVVIALPSQLHTECTIRALEAGKSVVCEKPMALSLKDAEAMIEASRRKACLLTVFQNRRYAPDFLTVKRVLDSEILGRIVMIRIAAHSYGRRWDWQTLKKFGGGTLNNTCSHFVDQALVFFDQGEPHVFCVMDSVLSLGDAEDHVKIVLTGPKSPTVEIEATSSCAYPQQSWMVMGSRGGLSGSSQKLTWRYTDSAHLIRRRLDPAPTPDRSYNADDVQWQEASWEAPRGGMEFSGQFYLDLFETIRHGEKLAITPESVVRQIRILDECRRQNRI